jgi:hypothetical protein
MRVVDMDIDYIGGDIVGELIQKNKRQYRRKSRRFLELDIMLDDLPRVDLLLCRDCLVHFSIQDVYRALRNVKRSGSTYVLTTTFVDERPNEEIQTGGWRPINLQLPPFRFPTPARLINEHCPVDGFRDKHLGLWRTSDIPDY